MIVDLPVVAYTYLRLHRLVKDTKMGQVGAAFVVGGGVYLDLQTREALSG